MLSGGFIYLNTGPNILLRFGAYYARYLLNEYSIRDGSDAPQYLT